jgi:hypothetical protein
VSVDKLALALALLALILAGWTGLTARRERRSRAGYGATAPRAAWSSAESEQPRSGGTQPAAGALRHVSVVRYDAFDDVAGRQSFTAALLDDRGEGLVITALHGRAESRTFLKGVGGSARDELSPEEKRAVAYAMEETG